MIFIIEIAFVGTLLFYTFVYCLKFITLYNMTVKRIVIKTLKVLMWTSISIIAIIALGLGSIVWILSPEQLTKISEKYANEYLNATVKIERVELTIWKTFPYATIDVDNLTIISHGFDSLSANERAKLPAYSDTLISTRKFHAGINIVKALSQQFILQDIMIDAPRINLVTYSPSVTNYDIVPPSDSESSIPEISLNSFEISNCRGINYFSAPDSTEVNINLSAAQFIEGKKDKYQLVIKGNSSVTIGNEPIITALPYSIDGIIGWDAKKPLHLSLDDWKISILDFPIKMNLDLSLEPSMILKSFEMESGPINIMSIFSALPPDLATQVKDVNTNMTVTINSKLTSPYDFSLGNIPSITADIIIPPSFIESKKSGRLNKIAMTASADINGSNLDKSYIKLKEFAIEGRSLRFNINGIADNLISDPNIIGEISGKGNISKIISVFRIPVDFEVSGTIIADTKFKLHKSDLNRKSYQKINVDGWVTLNNFKYFNSADSTHIFTKSSRFTLGTNSTVHKGDTTFRNLLTASITIDTLSASVPDYTVMLKNIKLGAGSAGNLKSVMDTSEFKPLGMKIAAERFRMIGADSSRISLRDFGGGISFLKFATGSKKPIININISAKRASYRDKSSRMSITDGLFNFHAVPRIRISRLKMRIDSLAAIYPQLSHDSLTVMAQKLRRKNPNMAKKASEELDLSMDSGLKAIMGRWNIHGTITAKRGRAFSPYFPIRNTLNDINLDFSFDSIIINNAKYRAGNSMFDIKGGIHNMRTTLNGRNRRPLSLNFDIYSDTLDVNELIKTAFAGSAYAASSDKIDMTSSDTDADFDKLAKQATENTDTTSLTAIIIPGNIDADIDIRSKYGVYANMIFHDLSTCLQMHDGAASINRFEAKSNMGDVNLSALYAAPSKKQIKFAFELGMSNVQLDEFVKLIPALDTIMPLLNSMDGIIQAEIAASTEVDSSMNIIMPSLEAAVKLHGDSLVLFDSETFSKVSKMLRFKNKKRNLIDNMTVELLIKNSELDLFPFMFTMDRYKLGVMGHNDLALNLNYHVSVLKSPIPFKFGLNITGNADNMKFRLGKARYKEGNFPERTRIVSDTRINLRKQIEDVLNRGAHAALASKLGVSSIGDSNNNLTVDNLTHEDSLKMIKEGLIEAPVQPQLTPKQLKDKEKADKKKKKEEEKAAKRREKEEQNKKSKDISLFIFPKKD